MNRPMMVNFECSFKLRGKKYILSHSAQLLALRDKWFKIKVLKFDLLLVLRVCVEDDSKLLPCKVLAQYL